MAFVGPVAVAIQLYSHGRSLLLAAVVVTLVIMKVGQLGCGRAFESLGGIIQLLDNADAAAIPSI